VHPVGRRIDELDGERSARDDEARDEHGEERGRVRRIGEGEIEPAAAAARLSDRNNAGCAQMHAPGLQVHGLQSGEDAAAEEPEIGAFFGSEIIAVESPTPWMKP
jgi:hypothetical protein